MMITRRFSRAVLAFSVLTAFATRSFAEDEKKIAINGNDQMKYDLTAFEVKAGEKVTVTLKNIGKFPKTAMSHNFILLQPGTDVTAFATAALTHAAEGYIPPDQKDKIIVQTKMLGPDESDSVTFTAPAAGGYDYICTFPGHALTGMRGVMTVK